MTFECCASVAELRLADTIRAVGLACNRWDCDHCGPAKAKLLARDIREGEPNKFLTLTVNPAVGSSPADRAHRLKDAWTAAVRVLRKRFDSTLEYVAVFEATERGEPHMHLALRAEAFIPQRVISFLMKKLLGAPIVDIRQCDGVAHVADYVTKYVTKDLHKFEGVYRYSFSRSYRRRGPLKDEPVMDHNEKWEHVNTSLIGWCDVKWLNGYTVRVADGGATAVMDGMNNWATPWRHPLAQEPYQRGTGP